MSIRSSVKSVRSLALGIQMRAAMYAPVSVLSSGLRHAPQRDPLFELPQRHLVQPIVELRLSREHDLQQLVRAGLDIRDSRMLFEQGIGRFCASSTMSAVSPPAWCADR